LRGVRLTPEDPHVPQAPSLLDSFRETVIDPFAVNLAGRPTPLSARSSTPTTSTARSRSRCTDKSS